MDRPKALALSVSLTGVIAAATVALALNFGLVGAAATSSPAPTASVAGASTAGSVTTDQSTRLSVPNVSFGDDDEHESDGASASSGDAPVFSFGGGEDD